MAEKCAAKVEVWARVVGFFRPLSQWNRGQRAQYQARTPYQVTIEEQSHDKG